MSTKVPFTIEKKRFTSDISILHKKNFTVKSVPMPYVVSTNTLTDPATLINKEVSKNKNCVILVDSNVYRLYCKSLKINKERVFVAPATEEFKTIIGVMKVVKFLQELQVTKGERLIVIGGGIIQDVGAFVGAVYKRGIPWTFIPTTLLSMCDSCIGGKTGINHGSAKNQLALFSAPREVIINVNFLRSLDDFAIKAGMGEILKLLITGGHKFIDLYDHNVRSGKVIKFNSYITIILAALAVKRSIVEEDEFELDHRRSLNYGHTIGHAVEALSKYRIPHGQAVSIGVILANEISAGRGILSKSEKDKLNSMAFSLIDADALKCMKSLPLENISQLLSKDKKTLGKVLTLVVIKKAGYTIFITIHNDDKFKNELKQIIKREFADKWQSIS